MAFQEGEGRVQGPETRGRGQLGRARGHLRGHRGGTGGGRGAQRPGRETTARTSLEDSGNRLRGPWGRHVAPSVDSGWGEDGGRTEHRAGTWRAEGPSRGLSGVRRGPSEGGDVDEEDDREASDGAQVPPPLPQRSRLRPRPRRQGARPALLTGPGTRQERVSHAAASLPALGGRGAQRRRPTAAASAPRKGRLPAVTLRVPEDGSLARGVPGGGGGVPRPDLVAVGTWVQRRGAVWSDGTPELPWHFSQPYVAL